MGKNKIFYIMLAFFVVVVWGLSLIATRALLDNFFTPNLITFFRFSLAFLFIFLASKKKRKIKIEKKDKKYFYLLGVCGVSLFYFFENLGVKYTTVGNVSLITSTIPLFTLLFAVIFLKKKLLWQNIIGIPLGLLGTFLLFYKDINASQSQLKGDILTFVTVFLWIIYSFSYNKVMKRYDADIILLHTFKYAVIFLIPLLLLEWRHLSLLKINTISISALLYLSVFASFLGYLFWNISIKAIGVKTTSNLILLMPIVSVTAGIIFYNEPISENIIFSTILIIASAYLTSLSTGESSF